MRKVYLIWFFMLFISFEGFAVDGSHVDTGVTAWMLTSTALVLLMVPGLAMFYGGLVRSKNVLGTMMHSFAAMAVIVSLWFKKLYKNKYTNFG